MSHITFEILLIFQRKKGVILGRQLNYFSTYRPRIVNIFAEGELKKEGTVSKMEIVQMEGNRNV